MDYNIQVDKITEQVEEQSIKYIPKSEKGEQELRIEILSHALKTANRIIDFNERHERQKHFWRKFFIISFCFLLLISFGIVVILLCLEKLSDLQLSVLIGNVIVEIFAIIFFMIKYVHNDLYLDTFKTVTQNLLDYLIRDKGEKENSDKASRKDG